MKSKLILLFVVASTLLSAQQMGSHYFPIINYSRDDYAAGNQNWDIIQDEKGWIYVANNNGMMEFDGNRWRHFPVKNESNVRALCVGEKGRIYAGASKEFGYFEYNEIGIPYYHSLIDLVPQSPDQIGIIWQIFSLGSAYVFVSGKREIYFYENEKITITKMPEDILFSQLVNNLLYVATDKGLYIYRNKQFDKLPNMQQLDNKHICGITLRNDGALIIATDNSGFYTYYERKLDIWHTEDDQFIKSNLIYCTASSSNYIAVGTVKDGVVIMDMQGKTLRKIDRKTGLQNNTILSSFFDKNNTLWLGLDKGLDIICTNSPVTDLYEKDLFLGAGYCSLIANNILYLGTNQGLYCAKWSDVSSSTILPISGLDGQVWNLQQIDGDIFCSHHEGLFLIEGQKVTRIGDIKGVWKVMKWSSSKMLVGTYNGFYTIIKEDNRWKLLNHIDSFDDSCRVMEWDQDGSLWMAHGNVGIFRFYFNSDLTAIVTKQFYGIADGLPSNINNAVYKIKNQILFNTINGIYSYQVSTNKIVPLESEKITGLQQYYTMLYSEKDGAYWYISDFALGYYEENGIEKKNLFGFFCNKMIGGFEHLFPIEKGKAILSTENGFSLIDITRINKAEKEIKSTIRGVYSIYYNDSLLYGNTDNTTEHTLRLPYKYNSVRLQWSTPSYEKYTNIEYSYALEGSKYPEWSDWSDKAQKEYNELSEGEYIFKVRTRSVFIDAISETSLRIIITPPWFRSNLAKTIYVILILCCIVLFFFLVKRIIKRNTMKVEEISKRELEKRDQKIYALKEERLANELRMKNQELSTSVMNVIRKNEILLKIKERVAVTYSNNLQKDSVSVGRNLLELQNIISDNISYDDEWERFEKNYDLANSDFLKHLQKEFTTLSIQEKKLCVFLKMDLSTKEIAPLLGISDRGVEISRYRLRKKFGLDRSENLIDFLQTYDERNSKPKG